MRVGICLPIGERGPDRVAKSYREMRELAVAADQNGADSIWVADHIFYAPDGVGVMDDGGGVVGIWESMTMLSALAEATSRAELGPLVMCTPFRNPGLIAWMATAIDEISGGRFVMGLGAGWHQPEFDAFRFNFERRVSVFADSLEVIVPLLREGRVDYDGEFAGGHAELRPRSPRAGGPPILIAGTKPRMMALTARWADRWNSVWYGMPTDEFRDERSDLVAACEKVGRDPATIEVSAGLAVVDREKPAEGLGGTVAEIAEGLAAWKEEGVTEVMCRMDPPSVDLVERITDAATQVR